MFQLNQPPAGTMRGKECAVRIPIQQTGRYRCRRCGTYRQSPEPHIAIMSLECPGRDLEFQDLEPSS